MLRVLIMDRLFWGAILKPDRLGWLSFWFAATLLTSCSPDQRLGEPDWKDRAIFVQVGEVVYELPPGRNYSLDGMNDSQIAAKIEMGRGVLPSPIKLQTLRILVPQKDGRGPDFDVIIIESRPKSASFKAAPELSSLSDLKAVQFTQSEDQVDGNRFQGFATLQFANDAPIQLSVRCRLGAVTGLELNVFCSTSHLLYRGNLVALRARGGNADRVAQEFQDGLRLIPKIERN